MTVLSTNKRFSVNHKILCFRNKFIMDIDVKRFKREQVIGLQLFVTGFMSVEDKKVPHAKLNRIETTNGMYCVWFFCFVCNITQIY